MGGGTMMYESLPNLPGYKARMPLEAGDKKHYKKTTLTYLRGYAVDETPVHADVNPPPESTPKVTDTAQPPLQQSSPDPKTADFHFDSSKGPKWVQNDRKVLRWYGFFKEAVPESPVENFRVRKIVVCHYLADDTTEVVEPKDVNSGIWQGTLIKRHKIPKANGQIYTATDIAVGDNIDMYGKVFHVVDADSFTRKYLADMDRPLGEAEPYPLDPIGSKKLAATHQKEVEEKAGQAQSTGRPALGRLQTYLLNSKKVLRFYCVWDDRQQLYGDRRPFRLHYYLEDDTVEILELHEQNSGRDHFPVFLKRCQLPKDPTIFKAGKDLDKRLCYGLEDLRIGTFVPVYGRAFFIHDCDDFTRRWYQESMGYSDQELAPVDVRELVPGLKTKILPPYNGYGSLEDSAENCRHLIPKPPKKDFYKLINKGTIVLRFGTRFEGSPDHPVSEDHRERKFVINYFMADDTISIFEHATDGFPGGKFLERGRVPRGKATSADFMTDKDLFVGAHIQIYKHVFTIENADEYTLQYMENNRREYPMADWESALHAAQQAVQDGGDKMRAALVEIDNMASGLLTVRQLEDVFKLADIPLALHQVICLHRHLAGAKYCPTVATDALLQALKIA